MLHRSYAPIVLVLALLCAACGARLSDEQVAAIQTGGASDPTGLATGVDPGTAGTPGSAGSGPTTSVPAGGPAAPGTPGAPGGPAAPAPGAEGTAPGAAPVAADGCAPTPGSTDPGVTDTEIVLGNVSTISGPVPGFGESGVNAVKAYLNFVNSQGGVCGRQLTLQTADDGLQAGRNGAETQRLGESVFALVGGTSVVDNGGAAAVSGGIPDVSLSIGAERRNSPNNFSPNPIPATGNGAAAIMRYFAQNSGVTRAAIVYPNQPDARTSGMAYRLDLEGAGIAVDEYQVAVTETNYASVANQISNSGAQLVVTTLEVNGMANLAKAFQSVANPPAVRFYGAQAYGESFLAQAGTAADGTTLALTFSIFEDAPQNPPMATFLEWYGRTNPGSQPDFFSIMGWASAEIFVTALRQAGGAPTRAGVLDQLRTINAYDGDGFMVPRDPAGKTLSECFVVVTVVGGQWQRVEPAQGFLGC